jgi:hypothetical protein
MSSLIHTSSNMKLLQRIISCRRASFLAKFKTIVAHKNCDVVQNNALNQTPSSLHLRSLNLKPAPSQDHSLSSLLNQLKPSHNLKLMPRNFLNLQVSNSRNEKALFFGRAKRD